MTLTDSVIESYPFLKPHLLTQYKLADIFTIVYDGTLIGYYCPERNLIRIDGDEVARVSKHESH